MKSPATFCPRALVSNEAVVCPFCYVTFLHWFLGLFLELHYQDAGFSLSWFAWIAYGSWMGTWKTTFWESWMTWNGQSTTHGPLSQPSPAESCGFGCCWKVLGFYPMLAWQLRQDVLYDNGHWAVKQDCRRKERQRLANSTKCLSSIH